MKTFIKETLSHEKRISKEDGGLAWHTMNAEIVARERGLKQRKVLEGIEALRQRPPNSFDHDDTWKLICRRR